MGVARLELGCLVRHCDRGQSCSPFAGFGGELTDFSPHGFGRKQRSALLFPGAMTDLLDLLKQRECRCA